MADRAFVLVFVLVSASAIVEAAPKVDRRDIGGGLSFALPAGWKLDQPAGQDHAQLTFADAKRYCIVSLYRPITSDNPELDFKREWHAIGGTIKDTEPKLARRKIGGRDVIEATGTVTVDDGSVVFERVGVIAGSGQIAAMIVMTSNDMTMRACKADSDAMYKSVTFSPAPAVTAAPTVTAPPTPAVSTKAAATGLLGTLKSSIVAADLVGTWNSGASVVTSYYSSSTGDYAGASASFASMAFTFNANGTYDYSESGMSNGSRFKNKDSGTYALSGGNVTLKAKNGREQTKQLIAFMDTPEGLGVMTLYSVYPSGAPLDAAGIASGCYVKDGMYQCTNGEIWSRGKKK